MGSVTIGTAGALGLHRQGEEGEEGRGSSTGLNVIRGDVKLTCWRGVVAFREMCLGGKERKVCKGGETSASSAVRWL